MLEPERFFKNRQAALYAASINGLMYEGKG